ncbi:MAG TPA: HAD family hydrolase, partial [Bacillota bacterium]|nr:HAD family hydrolase [Bacillota bacterium]
MLYSQEKLQSFQPRHEFFIGLDSDGCVFDTMEIKQKECFCPVNIRVWGLQPIAKYVRETVEFVNLYSKWRGTNRFPALLKVFEYLAERPEVRTRGFKVPELKGLREWVDSGAPLGNANLAAAAAETGNVDLIKTLDWSNAVNEAIAALVSGIPPFPYVRESLDKMSGKADIICVSQTPAEAIEREWAENGLSKYASIIAGQEYGTKKEHLKLAAVGKYPANHILMVGDAEGDLAAAQANGVLFYPINPGHEEFSWKRFYEEALDRFFAGKYEGEYEAALTREFREYLPETPPWQ